MEAAALLTAKLEAAGASVVNGSCALNLQLNKAKLEHLLQEEQIPTPHKIAVVGKTKLVDALRGWSQSHALLLTHDHCVSGTGVRVPDMSRGPHFFCKKEDALAYIESPDSEKSMDGTTLIEEYIAPPDGFLLRLEFVGCKYLYAVKVTTKVLTKTTTSGQEKRAQSAVVVVPEFTHSIIEKLEKMLAKANLDICGVEIVVDEKGDAFVIDINSWNTNCNPAAEVRAGLRHGGCDAVAALLEQRLATPNKRLGESKLDSAAKRPRLVSLDSDRRDASETAILAWADSFGA
jgi:hypothetical protein